MFADALLDYTGLRHLWEQLRHFADDDYVKKDALITKAQIDSLFTDEEHDNEGEG